jgi:hypothetical protein
MNREDAYEFGIRAVKGPVLGEPCRRIDGKSAEIIATLF